jgi:hypothetical protein
MRSVTLAVDRLIIAFIALFFSIPVVVAAEAVSSTVTVYAWPLAAPSPTSFATIALSASQAEPIAEVNSLHLPLIQPSTDEIVRIGLYDPATKQWRGTATAASSFAPGLARKLTLHIDGDGNAYHASLSAFELPEKSKKKDGLEVEVIPLRPGPQPLLNKPVVLNADGKVQQVEEKDQRSFLQK